MYSKLSLRNARRQARDYLVYFVTVLLTVALIHAFNGLVTSGELKELSFAMDSLPIVIGVASIAVVGIVGWLVSYTMRFMLQKRSRELGTYILLGLENHQVARLFFLENLAVGIVALAGGILLGNLLFQCLRAILLWMFRIPYQFNFSLFLPAIGLTILYFAAIYLFALWRSRSCIRRLRIADLVQMDRRNEQEAVKAVKTRRRMSRWSLVCGVLGTTLLMVPNLLTCLLGIIFVTLFLYGFFLSFSSSVPAWFERRPEIKFQNTNLLVFRTLAAKMNTVGITMATIALLITGTLLASGTGVLLANLIDRRDIMDSSFDVFITTSNVGSGLDEYMKSLSKLVPVRADYEYHLYGDEESQIIAYVKSIEPKFIWYPDAGVLMGESDYAALRRMLGYPEVEIAPDTYLIHCVDYLERGMKAFTEPLTFSGQTLQPGGVCSEGFCQDSGNGRHFLVIVPDTLVDTLQPTRIAYAAMTEAPVLLPELEVLWEIGGKRYRENGQYEDSVYAQAYNRESNTAMYTLFVFPLLYFALILTMIAGTILTIHLLSDTARQRQHYRLMACLGMEQDVMRSSLRRQFAVFFAMPAIPAMIIGISFLWSFGNLMDPGIIRNTAHHWAMIGATLLTFFAFYLIYIVVSYNCFKRAALDSIDM